MKKIYLAGAMSGRKGEEVLKERQEAVQLLHDNGFEVLDPIRDRTYILTDKKISASLHGALSSREIVQRDLHDVENSDYVVILTGDAPGMVGSIFEWAWARAHNKPVFVVSTKPKELGSWKTEMMTRAFPSIQKLAEHLKNFWR